MNKPKVHFYTNTGFYCRPDHGSSSNGAGDWKHVTCLACMRRWACYFPYGVELMRNPIWMQQHAAKEAVKQ